MEINKEEFKIWIAALRSGEYMQSKDSLNNSLGYCCLGVGVCVLVPHDKIELDSMGLFIDGDYPSEQTHAPQWLKEINDNFLMRYGKYQSHLNDIENLSFNEIADILERTYFPNGYQ